jgi:hypothetical protein
VITEGPDRIEDPHDATPSTMAANTITLHHAYHGVPFSGAVFPFLFDTVMQILRIASGRLHPSRGDSRASP